MDEYEVRPMKQKEIGMSCRATRRGRGLWSALEGSREALFFASFAVSLCFGNFDFRNLQFFWGFLDFLTVLEEGGRLDLKIKQPNSIGLFGFFR